MQTNLARSRAQVTAWRSAATAPCSAPCRCAPIATLSTAVVVTTQSARVMAPMFRCGGLSPGSRPLRTSRACTATAPALTAFSTAVSLVLTPLTGEYTFFTRLLLLLLLLHCATWLKTHRLWFVCAVTCTLLCKCAYPWLLLVRLCLPCVMQMVLC